MGESGELKCGLGGEKINEGRKIRRDNIKRSEIRHGTPGLERNRFLKE